MHAAHHVHLHIHKHTEVVQKHMLRYLADRHEGVYLVEENHAGLLLARNLE